MQMNVFFIYSVYSDTTPDKLCIMFVDTVCPKTGMHRT